jgi:cytochrome c553
MEINLPEPTPREKNRLAAFADRQAVFKAGCAQCHLDPAAGKPVAAQYATLCGTCHEAKDRAQMVPDLAAVQKAQDRAYWEEWVRRGKPSTYMPAYAKRYGEPLSDDQVAVLVRYLCDRYQTPGAASGGK